MSARGGKRSGAGRKPGKIGKAKRQLSDMAMTHASAALKTLADIATKGESEAARVSAATAILDRAYGKPPQAIDHKSSDGTMTPRPSTIRIVAADGSDSSATT